MEELIKQAFAHVDIIGPHVAEGHYDLIGPNGEIILPQVWETMIEPDWSITMHMWPIPERPKPPPGPPPGQAPFGARPLSAHGSRHRGPPPGPPPSGHRGGPPPPPPGGWPPGAGPPPVRGPGPAPGVVIVDAAPKSKKKPEPPKGVLAWMSGKPAKPSGKGPLLLLLEILNLDID